MEKRRQSLGERIEQLLFLFHFSYDWMQKNQIRKGLKMGLDVSHYKNKSLDWTEMREVRLGLEDKLDVNQYINKGLSMEQMGEVRSGLKKNLDVSFYNRKDFDWMQMREIRMGLSKDLDVSFYSKEDLSMEQMEEIRLGLERNLDVTYFNDSSYSWMQMRELRRGLENEIDISLYDNPSYSWDQMKEIRLGLEDDLNVFEYLGSNISVKTMKNRRLKQLKERHEKEVTLGNSKVVSKKMKGEKQKIREIPKEEIKLTRYDTNYLFPLIKRYKTVEGFKEGIESEYTNPKQASSTLDMLSKKIDKLVDNGYLSVVGNKYEITNKAIEESKTISQEFEFTNYDSNVIFKYIKDAGGILDLGKLEEKIASEYTDPDYSLKQFNYIKRRIENNVKAGYLMKSEDNIYSISEKGYQKVNEINNQILPNESQESELSDELEI